MQHIYENITGWFSFPEFYRSMIERVEKALFVEVGVFEGRSLSFLVVEVINSGKPIEVVGVDAFPWEGLEEKFKKNMEPLAGHFKYIKGESSEVAAQFEDQSIDMVFIDGNHTYEFVKRDILAYLPKMKPGSVMAGHDHNDQHPGVIQAVHEIFGSRAKYDPVEDVWYVQL